MGKILCLFALWGLISCATGSRHVASEVGPSVWVFDRTLYKSKNPLAEDVYLRTGYYRETAPLKGCVLYLEGLADSVSNQSPLFAQLSRNGYRVIFFDYMGQGGSDGSMNNSRIVSALSPTLQIPVQGKWVWDRYAGVKENGVDCSASKKMVLGWSTGGLAAYELAHEGWAQAVVLISPGLHVKTFIGESATNRALMLKGAQVITERTLTRNTFAGGVDPHIDPIRPVSPALIPIFATNLLYSSTRSRSWEIPREVAGLAFLSSEKDTYVNSPAISATLRERAPHFEQVHYAEGALHELQNEMPEVSEDLRSRTVEFLNRVSR